MAQKTLTDRDRYSILIQATSAGVESVTVMITDAAGNFESAVVNPADDLTAAQRTALNNAAAAFRARARIIGGWT
jgi:hypothetical protein